MGVVENFHYGPLRNAIEPVMINVHPVLLVIVAFVIAAPIAYIAANEWLEDFFGFITVTL